MNYFTKLILFISMFFSIFASDSVIGQNIDDYSSPVNNGKWVQPSQDYPSIPLWGHVNGIRVGLAPTPGPRGLLRIFTPYLDHKEYKVFNFIAFEPIPAGRKERGFSELEMSSLDNVRGKRFWSSNDSVCANPIQPVNPASGIIDLIDEKETLTVYIFSEKFDNGANTFVRLRFYEDKPYEFELTTYSCKESVELENFILTATMGNYARLRNLYLSDTVKSSLKLWPTYNDIHFTEHDVTHVDQMITDSKGGVYFIAEPDEKNPEDAVYAENTRHNWVYYGKKATQYWYVQNPDINMVGLVNGRYTYWGGNAPITGGISFENFEMKSPFKNNEVFIFGVTPLNAEEFISQIE